ncbi:MAG: tetratricopeptide repeat protein [Nitrospirota bacterium]|jgi:serine/threonine-protein kinase
MSEKPSFFSELKRRNVYKVGAAYAVVAWLLMQIASQIFPFFEIPNLVVRVVVLLLVIGFPIALIIAWAFEATPEGIKRTEAADAAGQRSRGSAWIYVVLIGAAFSVGLFFVGRYTARNARPRQSEATTTIPRKSIAVLPLINESGDPKDEYFSDGLSEELIAALAQISGLKVIGRGSSFQFKNRKEEPKTIGEKLGVSTLLEGTVRKQGDRVRIVAELINAADGIELWTRTFDRELKDIFAVQEEIARAVADSLKVTLLGTAEKSAQRAAPNSVEAHNAYLQGHFYLQRRNLEDFRRAVAYFDEAIRLDPNYALAYAERSEAWTFIGDLSPERKKEAWAAAKNDAEKAVAIGSNLAEAHAALGWVRFFSEWRFAEGLRELRRANELAPANPTTNDLLSRVLVYVGQLEEAEKLVRKAIELDPLAYFARNNLARLLLAEGKFDEADAEARKSVELQPTGAASHRWQVLVAIQRGDGESALREAQLEPDEGYRRFELALAHYARGDRPAADAALSEMIAKDRNLLAYQIAEVYASRGETDKAFEWLEISFDNRDTGMLALLIDPLMRGLRGDPRYKNLVAKVGLPTN